MRVQKKATEASECRSCGALILWTVTQKGKKMPVDAGPHEEGSFILTYSPAKNQLLSEYILGRRDKAPHTPEQLAGRRRFKSHFETCPNASEHRKDKAPRAEEPAF